MFYQLIARTPWKALYEAGVATMWMLRVY